MFIFPYITFPISVTISSSTTFSDVVVVVVVVGAVGVVGVVVVVASYCSSAEIAKLRKIKKKIMVLIFFI
jgi:NADH:ubiquinone oxidoreductase subunit 6 (subunit J)